ncbi:MAG TPA: hypothetical protein DD381_11820 [Lentisphaeria bacterium]|nr:MAG: hypothetical protein A2X47_02615 [Lentisphaerae bacterium GWF2_38_69]HBM17013.1 hypothetical protein [Lentisphaeria bacterium]
MNSNNLTQKTAILLLAFIFLILDSFTLMASEVIFESYTVSKNNIYSYIKNPLGCNYPESWKRDIVGNGKKWQMNTEVTKYYKNNGTLEIEGTTTLTNNNLIYGFTAGTFLIAKDVTGTPICIVGAKTNFIVDAATASNESAEIHGWGTNPAKLKFKNWKFYTNPTIRKCGWHATIPSSVMNFNPTIEIVQCHTPSNRALRGLGEFLKYALSFAIANGANIVDLVNKANNKTLTFSDFTNFTNNVIDWAGTQKIITSAQAEAARNIVDAIDAMEAEGIIGLQPKNHMALVNLAYAIQTVVNDKAQSVEATKQIMESLEALLQDQSAFVPTSMIHIETIVTNIKVLVNDNLTTQQRATFDKIIAVLSAINALPQEPVYRHMDIVFDAITSTIDLSQGNQTPATVKAKLDPLFDKIGAAIKAEYGENSIAMTHFDAFRKIEESVFVIIANGQNGWNSENLTTLINGFTVLAASISNEEVSIDTIINFRNGILAIVNNNGGWSFKNAEAIVGIIDGLQIFVQHPILAQLEEQLIALQN